jgi:hypothetical protein
VLTVPAQGPSLVNLRTWEMKYFTWRDRAFHQTGSNS